MAKKNKKNNDWKKRDGIVYSTHPENVFGDLLGSALGGSADDSKGNDTQKRATQSLHIRLEKKGRCGKTVTVIEDFEGSNEDHKALAKKLRQSVGTGGSEEGNDIVLQGDVRVKAKKLLEQWGYKTKGAI